MPSRHHKHRSHRRRSSGTSKRKTARSHHKKKSYATTTKRYRTSADFKRGRRQFRIKTSSRRRGAKSSHVSSAFTGKVLKAIQPPNVYEYVISSVTAAALNQCAYETPDALLEPSVLIKLLQTATQNLLSGPLNYNTDKLMIEHASFEVDIVNTSNAVVNIRWYDCKPRRDIPLAAGNIVSMFEEGFAFNIASTIGVTGTVPGATNSSATLFDCRNICDWFTLKMHTFRLIPGETKRITRHVPGFLINGARMVNAGVAATTPYQEYLKESLQTLIQFFGQPGNVTSNTGITPCEINTTYRYRYTYRYVTNNRGYHNTDETAFTATTNPAMIQIATGNLVTYTES